MHRQLPIWQNEALNLIIRSPAWGRAGVGMGAASRSVQAGVERHRRVLPTVIPTLG